MSTSSTVLNRQNESEKSQPDTMGVAAKRCLDSGPPEDAIAAKMAKLSPLLEPPPTTLSSCLGHSENSSDFLATSILAQTLLTSSNCPPLTADPLESLKSTLEALPAPMMPDSMGDIRSSTGLNSSTSSSTTIGGTNSTIGHHHHDSSSTQQQEYESYTSLLCTVVNSDRVSSSSSNSNNSSNRSNVPIISTGSSSSNNNNNEWSPKRRKSLSPVEDVITEEENGKSYYNLGPADSSILYKGRVLNDPWSHHRSLAGSNDSDMNDDNVSSSSSCDSISSEDLFNSGEEFDGSDDEDYEDEEDLEVHTYKQQRSTVLHLSLCKLNKFRTQQCVEPSLHRSVLICNTLRQIEREIKSEDELTDRTGEALKSREKLPPFWAATNNCHPHNPSPLLSPPPSPPGGGPGHPHLGVHHTPLLHPTSDPYLSYTGPSNGNPTPVAVTSTGPTTGDSSSPSYNNNLSIYSYHHHHMDSQLRSTPFHTASYDDYEDLHHQFPSPMTTPTTTSTGQLHPLETLTITASSSPGENDNNVTTTTGATMTTTIIDSCDGGYGSEDMSELGSYYFSSEGPGTPDGMLMHHTETSSSCSPTGSSSTLLVDDHMGSGTSTSPPMINSSNPYENFTSSFTTSSNNSTVDESQSLIICTSGDVTTNVVSSSSSAPIVFNGEEDKILNGRTESSFCEYFESSSTGSNLNERDTSSKELVEPIRKEDENLTIRRASTNDDECSSMEQDEGTAGAIIVNHNNNDNNNNNNNEDEEQQEDKEYFDNSSKISNETERSSTSNSNIGHLNSSKDLIPAFPLGSPESQCGMESLRSDLNTICCSSGHYGLSNENLILNPHHGNLPMDNLISPSYSSSSSM